MKNLPFEMAGGSIIGREHLTRKELVVGKNNQDGIYMCDFGDLLIAVVTDGCSDGKHSEFGAQFAARSLVATMERQYRAIIRRFKSCDKEIVPAFWREVQQDLLSQIDVLARSMTPSGESKSATLSEYFLFTINALIITEQWASLATCGDGVYIVNGELTEMKPFEGGKPPYLAYQLMRTEFDDRLDLLKLESRFVLHSEELESILIGSDGVSDLIGAQDAFIPGQQKLVGPIDQFWKEGSYFLNADAVRRKLALLNSSRKRFDRETGEVEHQLGLLPDDTTLIAVRRSLQGEHT